MIRSESDGIGRDGIGQFSFRYLLVDINKRFGGSEPFGLIQPFSVNDVSLQNISSEL